MGSKFQAEDLAKEVAKAAEPLEDEKLAQLSSEDGGVVFFFWGGGLWGI